MIKAVFQQLDDFFFLRDMFPIREMLNKFSTEGCGIYCKLLKERLLSFWDVSKGNLLILSNLLILVYATNAT